MNKILIGKDIVSSNDSVKILDNVITIDESGEYVIEYTESVNKKIIYDIYSDVKLIESSFDNQLVLDNNYVINKGNVTVIKFYDNLGVNEKINITLCSNNSKVDYKFANICKGIENYEININHKYMNTVSNIDNKSVALKNSKLNFIINSNVDKRANKSVINQSTRIVTMDECDTKIEPNMFIDLDDVVAKHGSIIGTFREEDIFYLMSKGISYSDSLRLLVKGYLFTNIGGYFDLRQKVVNIVNRYWR